jgi:hypothetical protein
MTFSNRTSGYNVFALSMVGDGLGFSANPPLALLFEGRADSAANKFVALGNENAEFHHVSGQKSGRHSRGMGVGAEDFDRSITAGD